uniref:Facilitated trehalose transporter Tret1 n=1 Tax=Cacopsylla melanoneura TaxID=428564 RepID=A0A8D8Z5P1_9HEMI
MVVMGFPLCVGWLILYFAQSIPIILLGTVCMSLGVGCVEAPILAYIGEACEPRLRGSLSSLTITALKLGVVLIFFINALTDWRTTMLGSAGFSILTTIMLACIPESPTWLVSKGRLKEAERSLRWVRGWSKNPKVSVEFDQLVQQTRTNTMNKTQAQGQFTHLSKPEFQRPFIMILMLYVITLISSLLPMRPFFVQISQTFRLPMRGEWVLVLTTLLNILGSVVGSFTIHRFGKRGISLWSMALNTIALVALSTCALNLQWSGWIPFSVFCLCYSISGYGIISLPWIYVAEVFPLEVRGVAAGLSGASSSLIIFISTKTYMSSVSWFGLHGTLFMYTTISFLGLVYIYLYVPETEGRSLDEIMQYFAGNKQALDSNKPKSNSSDNKPHS